MAHVDDGMLDISKLETVSKDLNNRMDSIRSI